LNPKNLSVIVVGDVLNNQERHDEKGYSGSDKKRHEATPDISSVHGNRPNEKVKSDRQANDRRVEDADVGKSVFVGIAPVLDWRHEAPGPEGEHDPGGNGEHDAQPGRRGNFARIAHVPPPKTTTLMLPYQRVRWASDSRRREGPAKRLDRAHFC